MKAAKINVIWVISLLVFVVGVLLALIITDQIMCADHLMQYISVISVVLSITLSIFAIMYTYFSNVEMQRQFDKINSAAERISKVSDVITKSNGLLEENVKTIISRISHTDDVMQALNDRFKNIDSQITATNYVGESTSQSVTNAQPCANQDDNQAVK